MPVTIASLDPSAHPHATATTYESLGAPYLLAKQAPASRIMLRFFSPTAFRAKEQNLPLPRSVFGGLLEKWNAFGLIALPDETRRFAEECVAVSRFRLRSRVWSAKQGRAQTGFVGAVAFAALNRDRYWLGLDERAGRLRILRRRWVSDHAGHGAVPAAGGDAGGQNG